MPEIKSITYEEIAADMALFDFVEFYTYLHIL